MQQEHCQWRALPRRVFILLIGIFIAVPLFAGLAAGVASNEQVGAGRPGREFPLRILGREVMVFRGTLGPYQADERAAAAEARIKELLTARLDFEVNSETAGENVNICVNGQTVFTVTPGDVSSLAGETLKSVSNRAEQRLELVLTESHELRDTRRLLMTLLRLAVAVGLWVAVVWALLRYRRWVERRLIKIIVERAEQFKSRTLRIVGLQNAAPLLRAISSTAFWMMVAVATFMWLEYLLVLFPQTRAFGEQLGGRFLSLLGLLGHSLLQALPGLGVVMIVWLCARFVATATKRYFSGIIRGSHKSHVFDAASAQVTQRLVVLLIWVTALIVAFPYVPGSQTPAFRGIGVLAGLMLSLGSTSLIAQWVNGLTLVYSRACQVGDFVRIGEHEGTLTHIGFSTSRLLTPLNEEIILPNSQLSAGSLINYSRFNETNGVAVSVPVSIGYNTPWRQVHAMLLEAAQRTGRLKSDPKPSVYQARLSDFYVEYQLRVVLENPAERPLILSQLHANIQDVFNEYGVQIMSPHYMADPPQPAIVPKEKWHTPPAGNCPPDRERSQLAAPGLSPPARNGPEGAVQL